MPFVLDCSIPMSWVSAEDANGTTEALRESLMNVRRIGASPRTTTATPLSDYRPPSKSLVIRLITNLLWSIQTISNGVITIVIVVCTV